MSRRTPVWWTLVVAGLALAGLSCSPGGPQVGSQTNWIRACESSEECGQLECICGTCTAVCSVDDECSSLPGASCVATGDPGAIALCGGSAPPAALCLSRCEDGGCPEGSSCVAGVCTPDTATSEVRLDLLTRYQTLDGFGAGVGFTEDLIHGHPANAALYDALFVDAGLDALRIRNRYDGVNTPDVTVTGAIVQAATERLGRAPLILINSSSPPAALKANGDRFCAGNQDTCTLARLGDGSFDYAGFAGYLRTSVEAYVAAGIPLDFLGIQNHPNLVPAAEAAGEGCRFLPEEGLETVSVDGIDVEVPIAGYRQALEAVRAELGDLPSAPRLAVADATGLRSASDYVPALEPNVFDAIVFHLYGVDPNAVDVSSFEAIRTLSEQRGRAALQSEAHADAPGTAVLIHHTLVSAGASAYLHSGLVTTTADDVATSLVLLTEDSFETQVLFDVFAHFSRHTDPGWVRVEVASSSPSLLVSGWLAPDERALTLVLVNPGVTDQSTVVAVPESFVGGPSTVTRTVFDGLERSVALGGLPPSGEVRLPAGSIVTVTLARD